MSIIKENNLTKYDNREETQPIYVIGNTYELQVDLNVRYGGSILYGRKKYSELTEDGKKHAYKQEYGVLKKGTRVTCQDIIADNFENIWLKIPSGFVAGIYEGKVFIK